MRNPFRGLLETEHVKLISRQARRRGFRGQDLDEVVQLTAIRLSRTKIRDEAIIVLATNESIADVCRRESCHHGRIDRLQELATVDRVEAAHATIAAVLDVRACAATMPETDQAICERLSQGRSQREVAASLGLSRSGLQHRIGHIRIHFTRCGLNGTT